MDRKDTTPNIDQSQSADESSNNDAEARLFIERLLTTYKPLGFFQGDVFSAVDKVINALDDDIDFPGYKEYLYCTLLSWDENKVIYINYKKAASETGPGYYENLLTKILSNILPPESLKTLKVKESEWSIYTVSVTVSFVYNGQEYNTENDFLLRSWTDWMLINLFLEKNTPTDLLEREPILCMHLTEYDGESAIIVPRLSNESRSVITDFENKYIRSENNKEEYNSSTFEILNPSEEANGPMVLDHLIGVVKDIEHELKRVSGNEKMSDRFSNILSNFMIWIFAIIALLLSASLAFFALGWGFKAYERVFAPVYETVENCYPFEMYDVETNTCSINCTEGETQEQCNERFIDLVRNYEKENNLPAREMAE